MAPLVPAVVAGARPCPSVIDGAPRAYSRCNLRRRPSLNRHTDSLASVDATMNQGTREAFGDRERTAAGAARAQSSSRSVSESAGRSGTIDEPTQRATVISGD